MEINSKIKPAKKSKNTRIIFSIIAFLIILSLLSLLWLFTPHKYYILRDVQQAGKSNWLLVVRPPSGVEDNRVKILDDPMIFNNYKDKVYRLKYPLELRMDFNVKGANIQSYQDGKYIDSRHFYIDEGIQYAGMDKYFKNAISHKVEDYDKEKVLEIYNEVLRNKDNYFLAPYKLNEKYEGYFQISTDVAGDKDAYSSNGESTRELVESEFSRIYGFRNKETDEASFIARVNGFNNDEVGWIIEVKCDKDYFQQFDMSLLSSSKIFKESSNWGYSFNKYGFEYFTLVD